MHKVNASEFVSALQLVSDLSEYAVYTPNMLLGDSKNIVLNQLDELIAQLEIMELSVSLKSANLLRFLINKSSEDTGHFATLVKRKVDELKGRIVDELDGKQVFYLNSVNAAYLNDSNNPFGNTVSDSFPSAVTDLSEAANCLGLSRATACVFHLMRAMELSVLQIGETLDVTIIDKNDTDLEWGKIIGNINDKIKSMDKGLDKDEWSEVSALLYNVKQAWRNKTMHPKATYTTEEARNIFESVKSFMKSLSKKI